MGLILIKRKIYTNTNKRIIHGMKTISFTTKTAINKYNIGTIIPTEAPTIVAIYATASVVAFGSVIGIALGSIIGIAFGSVIAIAVGAMPSTVGIHLNKDGIVA
jgi:hypothetical protein